MNNCGIIVEYNPFHNGHKFHIEKSKEITGADAVIAVMSGSFVQRGEPALFDKFIRAKAAIAGGVDLVIELPFCYACAPAQFFAEGAVRLLANTGIVNSLCFGSESGDIQALESSHNSSDKTKEYLACGMSYPAACAAASDNPLSSPNDILGAEYLRAVKSYAPELSAYALKRRDNGYHSLDAAGSFASATAIRSMIDGGNFSEIRNFVPAEIFELFEKEYNIGNYTDFSLLDSLVLGKLRTGISMADTAYAAEGIENRFYESSFAVSSIRELADSVKTKRYTYARLMRIIACYTAELTEGDLQEFVCTCPKYIRILAANETGKKMLSEMKKKATLPIITTPSAYKKLNSTGRKMFELDCRAADIASLCKKNPALRQGRQDFGKLNIFSD